MGTFKAKNYTVNSFLSQFFLREAELFIMQMAGRTEPKIATLSLAAPGGTEVAKATKLQLPVSRLSNLSN